MELSGREQAILDVVRGGRHAPLEFAAVTLGRVVVKVTTDALRLSSEEPVFSAARAAWSAAGLAAADVPKVVRVGVTPRLAQLLCDELDCILLTPVIADAVFDQAAVALDAAPQNVTAPHAELLHTRALDAELAGRSGLVGNAGKHWVLCRSVIEARGGRAANYGWHSPLRTAVARYPYASAGRPGLRATFVIQPAPTASASMAHNYVHWDYSQTWRAVQRQCLVDGHVRDLAEVLGDPALAPLVSHEGVLSASRLPAMSPGPSAPPPVTPAPPPVEGPRDLRRGDRGPDVAAMQRKVGANPDGLFGSITEGAVKAFQTQHGIAPTGVWGAKERAASAAPPPVPPPNTAAAERGDLWIPATQFTPVTGTPRRILWVVMHSTETYQRPGGARAVANVWSTPSSPQASAHYIVDNGQTVQCVREKDIAWAAPGANAGGIHIEQVARAVAFPGDAARHLPPDPATDWTTGWGLAVMQRSAALARAIADAHGVPLEVPSVEEVYALKPGIVSHRMITDAAQLAIRKGVKIDPWYRADRGMWVGGDHQDPGGPKDVHWPWERFLALVRA